MSDTPQPMSPRDRVNVVKRLNSGHLAKFYKADDRAHDLLRYEATVSQLEDRIMNALSETEGECGGDPNWGECIDVSPREDWCLRCRVIAALTMEPTDD